VWFLPISLLATATVLAIPLSRYFARLMDGEYHPPRLSQCFETRLDSGLRHWKQYATALLVFNAVLCMDGSDATITIQVNTGKALVLTPEARVQAWCRREV